MPRSSDYGSQPEYRTDSAPNRGDMHVVLVLEAAPMAAPRTRSCLCGLGVEAAPLKLVRFVPVVAHTYIDFEGHRQRRRLRHVGPERLHDGLDGVVRHLEDEFIMHLHDELSRHPRTLQPGVHLDHGAL